MPLPHGYAILRGHAVDGVLAKPGTDHYSIHVIDNDKDYRIAVNIRSNAKGFGKDLLFYLNEDFQHSMLEELVQLPVGLKKFEHNDGFEKRRESGVALDLIRMNLFDRTEMQVFPGQVPGKDNDLNELIHRLVQDARGDENSEVYAFGEPWGPEAKKDKIFGFQPGNGVHDIHMNQGDMTGEHAFEDGLYQDGGLIFHDSLTGKFIAYFTKFQSQSWHTDDTQGHAIDGAGNPTGAGNQPDHTGPGGGNPIGEGNDPDLSVRIVAAMVNPIGPAPERETVTLLNTLAVAVDLDGWMLADKQKRKMRLSGSLGKGETRKVDVVAPMSLANDGGIITLLNKQGVKVHGVSYTKGQAHREGVTITF
jgi:uncharacterized protein YukJ